jgi:DNA-binding IclR family transcriptional regulator
MNEPTVPISSVKRSYDVVDAIRHCGTAGVTELSKRLDRPKSTIHNHLRTLEQLGYVVKVNGEYRLSTRYFHIGWEARTNHEVFRHGLDSVKRLEQESGGHVQLLIEENGLGAILFATHWRQDDYTPAADRLSLTRVHLHTNAPGKAILARLPTDQLSVIIDRYGLPSRTDQTITDEQTLRSELEAIRSRGYAIDREETLVSSTGVGVAITTDSDVYGAVAVYGPSNEVVTTIENGELVSLVREHAKAIRDDLVFEYME